MVESSVAIIQVHHHPSEFQSNERLDEKQSIRDVLTNDSRWRSLYTILILGACIANAFILTSIPRQNSILFPDYWYEGIFCAVFGASFRDSCGHILDLFIFTREKFLLTWTHFMKVFFICSILFAAPYCISYYTWTLYIGYNHPMPFNGMFLLLGEIVTYMIIPWFLFPAKLRSKTELKRRFQIYLIWRLWLTQQMIPKEILSIVAGMDSIIQWTLPLLIPLVRISGCWVAQRIVEIFTDTNYEATQFLVTTSMMITYTTYITGRLYSLPQNTVYCLLTVETLLLIRGCYEIFKLNKKIRDSSSRDISAISLQRNKIESLVMNEFVEAIVPLSFGIAFSMAYYGPNAVLIKGIKNDYFGGQVVEDVQYVYFVMALMFIFDMFGVVITGTFLRYYCNIDLFQGFCDMIGKYWMIFLIKLPSIAKNFGSRDVNFGMDYSRSFLWITDEGRNNMICDSALISEEEKLLLLRNSTLC